MIRSAMIILLIAQTGFAANQIEKCPCQSDITDLQKRISLLETELREMQANSMPKRGWF